MDDEADALANYRRLAQELTDSMNDLDRRGIMASLDIKKPDPSAPYAVQTRCWRTINL